MDEIQKLVLQENGFIPDDLTGAFVRQHLAAGGLVNLHIAPTPLDAVAVWLKEHAMEAEHVAAIVGAEVPHFTLTVAQHGKERQLVRPWSGLIRAIAAILKA